MDCPKCNSKSCIKYGVVGGRQRFHCKDCKFSYTVSTIGKPVELKKFALEMYLEGNGFRQIGRMLKVSHVSAYNWVRKFGEQEAQIEQSAPPAPIIEMDELYTFIGVKKTSIGFGRQSIGCKKDFSGLRLAPEQVVQAINCIRK